MKTLKYISIVVLCLYFSSMQAQTKYPDNNVATTMHNAWGNIDSDANPWVDNMSRPNKINKGLDGRHVSIWASHGRYYNVSTNKWEWERPLLFCTTEDLFTQTIVIPYLIPMLENAGCYVFTPRERDWQTHEVIVDNDVFSDGIYSKANVTETKKVVGFARTKSTYKDNENPFTDGTAEIIPSTKKKDGSLVFYTPDIPEPGRYAVYVSYPEVDDALDAVGYTVVHKGVATQFSVNQQMGYGTWVYLGTFDFDKGRSADNMVYVSTSSKKKGHIGLDAVRFGGGMGNIERGGSVSGLPRCLEAARYYGQWAGAPYSIYSFKNSTDDYKDDINVRSEMTNWVGGGSCYIPTIKGLHVPLELSLAVHSDAGYHKDGKGIFGSLSIATTDYHEGRMNSGVSRQLSLDLASRLLTNLNTDMTQSLGYWKKRNLWDRNYSETRLPEVPASIIEMLSHQSFPDMAVAQHPYGKFLIARSIYKTLAKFICDEHGEKCVVEPLAPENFRIELKGKDKVILRWDGVDDENEPTACATSYNIYTSTGNKGFDNGRNVKKNEAKISLLPGVQYNFRITACNAGGESFPTEVLSAYIAPDAKGEILVVNGFQRLSAPEIIDNGREQGFDINSDEGVQRGLYAGWSGAQRDFEMSTMGRCEPGGMGYSGEELVGRFIAGNDFNYVASHTEAIASAGDYSVVSCSSTAMEKGLVNLRHYRLIDLAFGLQKDDGQLNMHFKTFTPSVRRQIKEFTSQGGAILASGSFLGSDMQTTEEQLFMRDVLKLNYVAGDGVSSSEVISGLGTKFNIFRSFNDQHYAVTHPECLAPTDGAICAMRYADNNSAAVAYQGSYNSFTMGFPFECIKDRQTKNLIMQGIINYLLK